MAAGDTTGAHAVGYGHHAAKETAEERRKMEMIKLSSSLGAGQFSEEVNLITRVHAALALRNLAAGNPSNRVLVGKIPELLPFRGLVDLLKEPGEPQEAAAGAIRDLAEGNIENQTYTSRADGIEPLVEMLITGRAAGKTIAADGIKNLSDVQQNVRQIINAGAIEPMVEILRSWEDDQGRSSAAAALGYLAKSSKATRVLISVIGAIK